MKVCILSTVDMSRMTMARIYTNYFDSLEIQYDYIYVDKFKDPIMANPRKLYPFHVKGHENDRFLFKILYYSKMRKFCKSIFKKEKYDFLVVWGSLSVFLFSDLIKKYFSNRCCINIRDFFYNDKKLMNYWMGVAMNASSFVTVSSDALIQYLPGKKFVTIHSLNESLVASTKPRKGLRNIDEPIRIMYIGWIGRMEYVCRLIDELKNDTRYEMYFIGMGSEEVDKYIDGQNISNVITHGRFDQEQTSLFLEKADVIYNLYGYQNKHFDTALSIKLYYAIYMHLPLIGFKGTYTLEIAKKCGIGFEVDEKDFSQIGDKFEKYYRTLDMESISKKCDDFIEEIRRNNKTLIQELDHFFK